MFLFFLFKCFRWWMLENNWLVFEWLLVLNKFKCICLCMWGLLVYFLRAPLLFWYYICCFSLLHLCNCTRRWVKFVCTYETFSLNFLVAFFLYKFCLHRFSLHLEWWVELLHLYLNECISWWLFKNLSLFAAYFWICLDTCRNTWLQKGGWIELNSICC